MRRVIWIVILLAIVLGLGWLMFRPRPIIVSTATIEVGTVRDAVEEEGKTRLDRTHLVTMPIDGRILPIDLEVGDAVERGQVVAQMEAIDLETRVAQAAARVRRLAGEIAQNDDTRLEETSIAGVSEYLRSLDRTVEAAESQTFASSARLEYARAELARTLELFREEAAAQQELDEAKLYEVESAVGARTNELTLRAVEAIRAAFRVVPVYIRQQMEMRAISREPLEAELANAQAALEQAERDLARALVVAPVKGVVLARHEASERVLPAGTVLLEIGEVDRIEIESDLLSQDAVRVRPGMSVELYGPAVGEMLVMTAVRLIEPRGFTKISSLGVEQQRVRVIVAVDDATRRELADRGRTLGVGYRVDVRIIVNERPDVVRCPKSAVFRAESGEWAVFRIVDGRASLTPVTLGLEGAEFDEVTNGLRDGDVVIVAPDASVEDGSLVSSN